MNYTITEKKIFYDYSTADSPPSSIQEKLAFAEIQSHFSKQFENSFPDRLTPKTIVIIPSLTLDQQMLRKMRGHLYYEERMLCMLLLLRMPATRIVYVTSIPIDPCI